MKETTGGLPMDDSERSPKTQEERATPEPPLWWPCPQAYDADSPGRRSRWAFVGQAVCISPRSRFDRAEEGTAELQRVGLDARTLFYRPAGDATHERRDAWEAHRAVARFALDSDLPHLLVLEDDVEFSPTLLDSDVRRAETAMASLPKRWRVLLLGHVPLASYPTFLHRSLWRTRSLHMHAYIMSREMMTWLAERPYDERPKATPWSLLTGKRAPTPGPNSCALLMPGVYALFPMICTRRYPREIAPKSSSSRAERLLDKGKAFVQQRSVLNLYETAMMVVLPLLIVAALIAVLIYVVPHALCGCFGFFPLKGDESVRPTTRQQHQRQNGRQDGREGGGALVRR